LSYFFLLKRRRASIREEGSQETSPYAEILVFFVLFLFAKEAQGFHSGRGLARNTSVCRDTGFLCLTFFFPKESKVFLYAGRARFFLLRYLVWRVSARLLSSFSCLFI
jgi:hypothetical protein